jgi:hypothetical protein
MDVDVMVVDTRRWRRRLWWAVVLLLVLAWGAELARVWRITNGNDLAVFLRAGERVVAGEDIYADTAAFQQALEAGTFSLRDDTVVWPYAYAPLIAVMMVPATYLPYAVVQALWWGLGVVSLLLGSWLTLRAVGVGRDSGGLEPQMLALVLLVLYRFEPAVSALRLGQIEPLQFLLMALTLYALQRSGSGWQAIGGAALGLATGLKFFPGALVALLVWRGRWRAAAWALGVAVVTIVGPALIAGFHPADYLRYASLYGIGGAFAAFPLNQSLNGFFSRNLIYNVFTATLKGLHLPTLAAALTLGSSAVIVAASAWLTRPTRLFAEDADEVDDGASFALAYGLAVMALLLVSPHSQVYAYVWALIPLLVLLSWQAMAAARPALGGWLGVIAAYLLIGRRIVVIHPGVTRFSQSHVLFGALFLWALLAMALWRSRSVGERVARRSQSGG